MFGRCRLGLGEIYQFVLESDAVHSMMFERVCDGIADGDFRSLAPEDDVHSVTLERGLELLAAPKRAARGAQPLREIGAHPEDGEAILLYAGRYGPYVKHGGINASLPKGADPEQLSVAEAVELLRARAATAKTKKKPRAKSGSRASATTKAKAAPKKGGTRKTGTKAAAKSSGKGTRKTTSRSSASTRKGSADGEG